MKMGKSSKMWNGVWFAVAACSLMIPSQLEAGNSVNGSHCYRPTGKNWGKGSFLMKMDNLYQVQMLL